ncbi:MAG TPA: hypothetical protein VHW67_11310 [Solirubrobacteraceae bacterium]|jgi:hypothetical protein|nr:hypothetical protein [Solirubrobacteraceae bacterium]
MSAGRPHLPGASLSVHPAVLDRRLRDLVAVGIAALVPAGIAIAIIVQTPHVTVGTAVLTLAAIVGIVGLYLLIVSNRLDVTVTIAVLYLALLDGPVKLGLGAGELSHGFRNVLILAICLGMVLRLFVNRDPIEWPPLMGWVGAFVGLVVLEAFNPKTHGFLHVIGGFRQQLQWVPFFFFGYVLIRSKRRMQQVFLILGVCALANGVVAAYQTELSPAQLASWGPGYRSVFQPTSVGHKAGQARVYESEGEARTRPLGLGSDSGFSGGLGLVALPGCLALLATWKSRRRWIAAVLALGAMLGVVTGLGRLQVVGAVLAVLAFAGLASLGGRRVTKALAATLIVVMLAIPAGAVLSSVVRNGTFKRYESITNSSAVSTIPSHKSSSWENIPSFLAKAPLGVGLGTVGAVSGFGGRVTELVEGHGVSAETQYNFVADELGAPGLLLWIALSLYIVSLTVRGIRKVPDGELVIMLAGIMAPFVALILTGFSGPFMTSAAHGPYFWFAIGVAAYWFAPLVRRSAAPAAAVTVPREAVAA